MTDVSVCQIEGFQAVWRSLRLFTTLTLLRLLLLCCQFTRSKKAFFALEVSFILILTNFN
jgi:hypothetical protein